MLNWLRPVRTKSWQNKLGLLLILQLWLQLISTTWSLLLWYTLLRLRSWRFICVRNGLSRIFSLQKKYFYTKFSFLVVDRTKSHLRIEKFSLCLQCFVNFSTNHMWTVHFSKIIISKVARFQHLPDSLDFRIWLGPGCKFPENTDRCIPMFIKIGKHFIHRDCAATFGLERKCVRLQK